MTTLRRGLWGLDPSQRDLWYSVPSPEPSDERLLCHRSNLDNLEALPRAGGGGVTVSFSVGAQNKTTDQNLWHQPSQSLLFALQPPVLRVSKHKPLLLLLLLRLTPNRHHFSVNPDTITLINGECPPPPPPQGVLHWGPLPYLCGDFKKRLCHMSLLPEKRPCPLSRSLIYKEICRMS